MDIIWQQPLDMINILQKHDYKYEYIPRTQLTHVLFLFFWGGGWYVFKSSPIPTRLLENLQHLASRASRIFACTCATLSCRSWSSKDERGTVEPQRFHEFSRRKNIEKLHVEITKMADPSSLPSPMVFHIEQHKNNIYTYMYIYIYIIYIIYIYISYIYCVSQCTNIFFQHPPLRILKMSAGCQKHLFLRPQHGNCHVWRV